MSRMAMVYLTPNPGSVGNPQEAIARIKALGLALSLESDGCFSVYGDETKLTLGLCARLRAIGLGIVAELERQKKHAEEQEAFKNRPKVLKLHTSTIGYEGTDRLDISRKTGDDGLFLAPTWQLLRDFHPQHTKTNLTAESFAKYAERYRREMVVSRQVNPSTWTAYAAAGELTLCCYCRTPDFCHRRLAVEELEAFAKRLGYEVMNLGERGSQPSLFGGA